MRITIVLAVLLAWCAPASAAPWLFVTDIHLNPASRDARPVRRGLDSNIALLDASIAEMRRVDPNPPVVVVGGDELAHHFDWSHAASTTADIVRRLDRAFPHAQFLMTLGNEDSACGDYQIAPNSPFLRELARIWEPLVNRHGAAPHFATTFPRDGFYVARLPVRGVRAVVVNDVFWSPRYRSCAPGGTLSGASIADVRRALSDGNDRHWILLHIPPGIDAYSTAHLVHRLVVVPFLQPQPREAFDELIADSKNRVTLVIAAHTHKFAFRLVGATAHPVPLLLLPSISPIFGNAPGFVTAGVDRDGILRDVDNHAYDGTTWHDLGGFPALGVRRFTGPALVDLQRRLANEGPLRKRYASLYEGGAPPEIDARNWPIYWCSATAETASAFRACTNAGGTSLLTSRGISAVVLVVAALAVATVVSIVVLRRPRRSRERDSGDS